MKKIKEKWRNHEYLESISEYVAAIVNGQPIIDGIDLSGISIGDSAILNELSDVNLFKSKINNSNFSYSTMMGSLSGSDFVNVNFVGSIFDQCLLSGSRINGCNFSKCKFIVKMNDAKCEGCCFISVVFKNSSSGFEYGGRRVSFVNCDFTNAIFDKITFRASRFLNCTFTNAKFKSCDLRGARFEGGILPSAEQFVHMDVPEQFLDGSKGGDNL